MNYSWVVRWSMGEVGGMTRNQPWVTYDGVQ